MLKPGDSYEKVYSSFRWNIPEYYNIGVDICDKHAHQRYRLALVYENEKGQVEKYTFWELKRFSNQFANALKASGLNAGDRVGILLPQCPETAIAHIATYKIGGIAIPLFTLFGTDALEYRLANSEARCLVTDTANLHKILQIRKGLPRLENIFVVGGGDNDKASDFWEALRKGSTGYTPIKTRADDPALIIYTSGTTRGRRKVHFTLTALCWAICLGWSFPIIFSPERMIFSGHRPIGPGSED